ncbi:hypothetical protein NMY22_g10528 [Coprinellus aureogranulatus]|nr:hypothetical protein NMY22_g10528 [Coprinellus aureogranulatus]
MPLQSQRTRTCEGCYKSFTATGFWSHLRQTTKEACQEVYARLQDVTQQDESNDNPEQPISPSLSPVPFEGDVFGSADDYLDYDFGQDVHVLPDPHPLDIADVLDSTTHQDDLQDEHQSIGMESENGMGNEDIDDEELEGLNERVENFESENGWEPPRTMPLTSGPSPPETSEDTVQDSTSVEEWLQAEGQRQEHVQRATARAPAVRKPYSTMYPSKKPGQPLEFRDTTDARYSKAVDSISGLWAPFNSRMDWEIAKWAKLRGPGSTAFSDLLAIPGVADALNLSYRNTQQLNSIIDAHLPSRPKFHRHEVVVANESFELYSRDVLDCIRALWADPEFIPHLIFEPERHYLDEDETIRAYHDMHTGKWWWAIQKAIEAKTKQTNVTVVPVVISTDRTQLTLFKGKVAYPVYMTIGNLPKHIRRKPSRQGQVLLAYLPVSKLEHITTKASRRRALANLFHACMSFILEPLKAAGIEGVLLRSGDGAIRRGFPILAAYVADYPEQVLVTGIKSGDCPRCPALKDTLGELWSALPVRDIGPILDALDTIDEGPTAFAQACAEAGIKPIQAPFWQDLPFVNIFQSITPDILHQLYQGVLKHIISWLRTMYGSAEIDARCRRLPPNHRIRLFLHGISHLSRVTGGEHDQISRFLLGVIAEMRLPDGFSNARVLKAVRGLLDFITLAQYPLHTSETLDDLEAALLMFHDNKSIFVDLGVRENFNKIVKLHYLGHYRVLIETFGTADNFNTEYTERLHIDLAKEAYRASNSKDEYSQMTAWLDRRERILLHDKYIRRQLERVEHAEDPSPSHSVAPILPPPSLPPDVEDGRLEWALARFLVRSENPDWSQRRIDELASTLHIPFGKLSLFHRIKFVSTDPYALNPDTEFTVDSIHAEPARADKYGKLIPGRFDTALIRYKNENNAGLKDWCIGRVRCVFKLPADARFCFSSKRPPSGFLAFVDWLTPLGTASVGRGHSLFKVSYRYQGGARHSSIIPVRLIHRSIHLLPCFGPVAPADWKSSNVLDLATSFYVNPFTDRDIHNLLT